MNSVAFIFTHAPHGTAAGREGLDALLATAALSDEVGVFFVGDGVLHLLPAQQPEIIFAKNYIATLKLLELYDIEAVYACTQSIEQRGIHPVNGWNIPVESVAAGVIQQLLANFDKIITF